MANGGPVRGTDPPAATPAAAAQASRKHLWLFGLALAALVWLPLPLFLAGNQRLVMAKVALRGVVTASLWAICLGRSAAGTTLPARVPPRFGLGSILVMLTCYGVLFAVLKLFDTPPGGHLAVGLFLFAIGVAQWRLRSPLRARVVSVATGVGCFLVTLVAASVWLPRPERAMLLEMSPELAGLSAILGYTAGGAVAAVFLVMNWIDRWWQSRSTSANSSPQHSAPAGQDG